MENQNLSDREKEIISQVVKCLGLNMSPKEQITKEGIIKIIQKLRLMDWNMEDFHENGIAVNSFKRACSKIGGGFHCYIPRDFGSLFASLSGKNMLVQKSIPDSGYQISPWPLWG